MTDPMARKPDLTPTERAAAEAIARCYVSDSAHLRTIVTK